MARHCFVVFAHLEAVVDTLYSKLDSLCTRIGDAIGPYNPRREVFAWGVVSCFAAYIFYRHAMHASRVIDDVRYFWLDDDQMISMRYARNLAEGHGLVFNVGERVEGYSDFGWTLIMSVVHLLGASDERAALYVQGIAFLLTAATLWLTRDLLRALGVKSLPVLLTALACVAVCPDVMYWATSGFSTSLSMFLEVLVVSRLLKLRRLDVVAAVALSLIPIARSDGLALWGGDVLLALVLCADRKRTSSILALTLLPLVAHLAFRLSYYGDWFPNTYYLKVVGRLDRIEKGFDYLYEFSERYLAVIIVAASVGLLLLAKRNPLGVVPFTALVPILCYSMATGGDNFRPYRFFGPIMPILIAFACAVAAKNLALRHWSVQGGLLVLLFATTIPHEDPLDQIAKVGRNGGPARQLIPALLLKKNASEDASVLVIPAGVVPYFSHLKTIDLMGKTDPHVARLDHHKGAGIAHGKFDGSYSLSLKPDYVISLKPRSFAKKAPSIAGDAKKSRLRRDYRLDLLSSDLFQKNYLDQPVVHRDLSSSNVIYVHKDSKEAKKRKSWKGVDVGPWEDHSR